MPKSNTKPLIKPQVQIQYEQVHFKIELAALTKLQAYCKFINSDQSYVIREALNHLFETDHAFQEFLAKGSESWEPSARRRRKQMNDFNSGRHYNGPIDRR